VRTLEYGKIKTTVHYSKHKVQKYQTYLNCRLPNSCAPFIT